MNGTARDVRTDARERHSLSLPPEVPTALRLWIFAQEGLK